MVDTIKNVATLVVAIGLLVAFGFLVRYLLKNVSGTEIEWGRNVYVFGGVEAIVFAAVGWLFGREVHREQAQSAEAQAKTAEAARTEADSAKVTAVADAAQSQANGVALTKAIEAKAAHLPSAQNMFQSFALAAPPQDTAAKVGELGKQQLDELADYARSLFPNA